MDTVSQKGVKPCLVVSPAGLEPASLVPHVYANLVRVHACFHSEDQEQNCTQLDYTKHPTVWQAQVMLTTATSFKIKNGLKLHIVEMGVLASWLPYYIYFLFSPKKYN